MLRVLLYRTRLGIAMRAVVDNRDLAALNGARPGQVSMFAWAIGASMAAIAGIFLAQEFGNLDSRRSRSSSSRPSRRRSSGGSAACR